MTHEGWHAIKQRNQTKPICIYPTLPLWAGCNTKSISSSGLKLVWIQSFPSLPVSIPRLNNPLCPLLLTRAFMPLPRALTRSETQTDSSRIWTRVTDSISYNDKRYYSIIFTQPLRSGYDTRLVASPRVKNLVCPTILPIPGGRIIGLIPFPRVLVLCEMQSVSSRIWTRVAVSISYDDNHYTTGTSSYCMLLSFKY